MGQIEKWVKVIQNHEGEMDIGTYRTFKLIIDEACRLESTIAQQQALIDELVERLKEAKEALNNVPCVGEVYDQQHSDTHMFATIDIKSTLIKAEKKGE